MQTSRVCCAANILLYQARHGIGSLHQQRSFCLYLYPLFFFFSTSFTTVIIVFNAHRYNIVANPFFTLDLYSCTCMHPYMPRSFATQALAAIPIMFNVPFFTALATDTAVPIMPLVPFRTTARTLATVPVMIA